MNGNRRGAICLLGAGASADAGYPLASDLLKSFRNLLEGLDDGSAYVAPEPNLPKTMFSQLDVFDRLWSAYESTTEGRRVYLEDFFAFYDNPHNVGRVFETEWGPRARHFETKLLRKLRGEALHVAYRELGAYQKTPADYLRLLFTLLGPEEHASVIATLNFDVTIEQQAHIASYNLHDGFRGVDKPEPPSEWEAEALQNLVKRWDHVSDIGHDFVGFADMPAGSRLILKLHGSLGWYSLEEGVDWIGRGKLQRHNPVYRFFRIPYQRFWEQELTNDDQILLVGEHGDGKLTRKAGALWMNPHMVFARAYKASPDPLTLELLRTFTKLVDAAAYIMTVGYSWSDAHINDILLGGLARGARLVHVGRNPAPEHVLKLWRRKFMTTFEFIRHRLFVFGGGAQQCLTGPCVVLPTGDQIRLDLVGELNEGLSSDLSLQVNMPDIDLDDPPQPAQLMVRPARK